MAGLHFDITGDNSNFMRKLDEARNGVRTTSKQIEESGISIESMFGRLAKGAAAFGAGFTAKELISNVVRVRGEFQQLEVAFKTMLGSEDKATTLMSQLVKTAATTPFDLQSVANGAKQLLAYGISAEAVNGTLVQLGDIAAGLSIPLNDLVWLYGTTMTQGRLFTQDFRQFQSRGIPLADELAKQFGVTKDKVSELVTAGKVGFPEVQKAIESMTSEGGKFGGLMAAQSRTITGQISNIEDSFSTMYNNIGKQSEGFINDALSGVSYLVANYEQVGKVILELATTYGVYKAVLMSVAAYQSMAVGITYAAEIAELSKLIPLKQQSANQDVIAAVASGKLTQAKAEQVIALRAEIAAKIQSLQATKTQAQAEFSSALASYKASRLRYTVAQEQVALAQSQMSIAIKSGTVEEIATAKKNAQTASLELNNAAVAKNTAHKGVNIAATNSKSASEALNTLETGLNTVAQNTNTTSTNILTVAKTKLAAASKALGLSMLANPYVLAAAAVAGLGYAIYKTATAETELDKAHKRLNDATSDVEKGLASEVSKLTSLERKLAETKKGTEEYNNIKKTIVDNYGKYYDGLDGEIERVGSLSTVYGQLVEAMRLSIGQRKFESFFKAEQDNLDKTIGEKLDTAYETLIDKYGKTKGGNLYNQFFDSAMHGEPLSPSTIKDLQNATFVDVKWGSNAKDGGVDFENSVFDLRPEISKEMKATEEVLDEYKSKFRIAEEDFAKMLSGNNTPTNEQPKDNKTLKQLLLDIDASKSKIKELQEQANKGLISSDKIKEEQDVLSKLTSDYKNRTGLEYGSTKQENQSDKLREQQQKLNLLMNKQALDQSRSEQDLQNQVAQAKIDSMQEGSDKTIAQMQLNHKKEMQQFEREKDDKLRKAIEDARAIFDAEEDAKKAKNPKHVKGTFDASGIKLSDSDTKQYDTQKGFIGEKQKRETEEYYKSLRDSYQDYTDQRIAIEEKFNADIATLQEARKKYDQEGNTEKVQQTDRAIAQATKDKGQGLMQLDYDKLKESPEYVRAFENLKQTSSETLNSLLSQLENAKHTAAKVLSPDQLREYTTTIQEIMDELDSRNPWQALSDKKQELADAEQELAQAQIELENARQTAETVKGGGKVEYTTTKFNQKTGKIDSTKAYLTEAQALDNVKDKTEKYNKSKDNVVDKSAKVKKAEKEVRDEIDELSKTISDVGDAIGGSAGEIIGLIGNIGSFTMMAMSGVEAAADTSATAISTVEKASVILAIIGAAIQIATKIFDLFGKDTTTEKYEDAKEAYESYINILDRVIEKQLELAESLSGDNANAAYAKAIEAIKEQSKNAKILGQQYLNSGASGKSHSKGYNEVEDMSWEGWNQAAQALGMSVDQFKNKMGGRMTGLFDLTDEQLVKLQDNAGIFWSQLDSDTQDYANQVADGVAKVAEVMEQRMVDVTLIDVDTLRSDFHDLLTDMDADTADFADNFEEYMKNAILNSMLKEQYMGRLTEWRKKFYAAMSGGVTEEEYNKLKAEGQQIADEMKVDRDNMKDMYGWTSGESTSQDSTKGGFETMSQDTGEELNGRFTALQISNEEIKNSMTLICSNLSSLCATAQDGNIFLMEMRNLAIMSNSYLEDIAGFQKKIVNDFGRRLESIDSGIQKFNSK